MYQYKIVNRKLLPLPFLAILSICIHRKPKIIPIIGVIEKANDKKTITIAGIASS
jgi:hypothetical protein